MKPCLLPSILAGVLLVAAATGCKEQHTETKHVPVPAAGSKQNQPPPLTLKSYDVPKNQGGQVKQILGKVFYGVKDKVAARAALSPDGQLVVVAPDTIQAGVKQLIDKMATRKVPAPASVEVTYWLVVGRPAAKMAIPAELGAVKPSLGTVMKAGGTPMEFALLERLRVRSLADRTGSTQGVYARLRQTVSFVGGRIVGDLDISVKRGKSRSQLETRVVLDESKQLVLGEAGFEPPADLWPLRTGTTKTRSTIYYVIQTKVTR